MQHLISWRARVPKGLADAIEWFVVLRIALTLVGLFAWLQFDLPGPCAYGLAWDHWHTLPPLDNQGIAFPLVGAWERWDACWYVKVASTGYLPDPDGVAFFPLLPFLMRLLGPFLGGDLALAGLVIAGAAYVAAVAGLYRLVGRDLGHDVAARAVLYLSVFPAAFFLLAPFTESLFLACSVWALVGARERRWTLAALAALLASLSRTQGVLLALPLAWEAVDQWWGARRDARRGRTSIEPAGSAAQPGVGAQRVLTGVARHAPAVIAACMPVVGFLAYVLSTTVLVGKSPLVAQDLWGGASFHPPWEVVASSVQWILTGSSQRGLQAVNLAGLLLFAALSVRGLRVLPAAYSLFAIPQILLLGLRIQPIPLTSTTRLLLVVFPVFVVLGQLGSRSWVHRLWLAVSVLLLGALTLMFLRGDFVA